MFLIKSVSQSTTICEVPAKEMGNTLGEGE